ncbi:MAG: hypothetical protein LBL94_09185 [Prevotellaceae bacterium]|jgi:energy-converting hydrogenase Eha subunit H|nr:hypothetical protein [Prevotellaceae bacterium]
MSELLKQALSSPAGSFAFVFSIMMLVGWAIHYITKFATKISEKHSTFEDKVKTVEKHIDDIRSDLAYMKGAMAQLILMSRDSKGNPIFQVKNSLSLTEAGVELAKEVGAEEIIINSHSSSFLRLKINV